MSYTKLLADIPDFTARTDLTAVIPTFISLAEDKISRMTRTAEQRKNVSQVAYSDPPAPSMVFKTDREIVMPVTIRAKDETGATLRVYENSPPASFREQRKNKSQASLWTPSPLASIPATHYDGNTFGGKTNLGLTDTTGAVFCVAFNLRELPTAPLVSHFINFFNASSSIPAFSVGVTASGEIRLVTRSGILQVNHTFSDFTVIVDTWHTLLMSIDAFSGIVKAYFDDVKSVDTVVFADNNAIDFSTLGLAIAGFGPIIGEMTQLGLAQYDIDVISTALTYPFLFALDLDNTSTRRRFFSASKIPIQYGTDRGLTPFGKTASIWIPDGAPDKNFGTEKGIALTAGLPTAFDTTKDFGVVSDLFGVLLNPNIGDSSEFIEIEYYAEWPALSGTVDTHWLIANHYDLYLFGVLAEAYFYLQNEKQELSHREKFRGAVDSINRTSQRKLRGTGPFVRRNPRRPTP